MPSHSSWGFPRNGMMDDLQTTDELISHPINGLNLGTSFSTTSSFYGGSDLIDEFQHQDQLSFLNETASGSLNSIHSLAIGPPKNEDLLYEMDSRSPSSEGMIFPYPAEAAPWRISPWDPTLPEPGLGGSRVCTLREGIARTGRVAGFCMGYRIRLARMMH